MKLNVKDVIGKIRWDNLRPEIYDTLNAMEYRDDLHYAGTGSLIFGTGSGVINNIPCSGEQLKFTFDNTTIKSGSFTIKKAY